ncbi:hypothetical protein BFJ63_vAg15456 [Fusarium oxysporum f. sp. narcissi]|uniref:Gem-associated protein 5 TPR domain-containing protein n=1 Tax=Fusarium oxysporum f. sp. narcissi TaxID=451672 RepID=A0A4Q2V956_FUSOX|nr:hypothetical protein BFJ63_vAg15456 [Fusarium oxysporum f. sp. narcissi]
MGANSAHLTNDDLRRQMLNTIFGWNKEVEGLIRDEMSRHPQGSPTRILLARWLGDIDTSIMNANFENMLALSGIGGHTSQQKLSHTYVQRLLEAGDGHAAVTIMLGMGDHNDAIEVYISHKRYMEALILTCLSAPSVWERQAFFAGDGGQTPVAAGVIPIADSAGSPAFSHVHNGEATTAFLCPSNTPVSTRERGHLPSIGEIPSDLNRQALRSAELSAVPYDYESRSGHDRTPSGNDNMMMGTALKRAATASPMMMREHAQRIVQLGEGDFPPPPDQATMLKLQQALLPL